VASAFPIDVSPVARRQRTEHRVTQRWVGNDGTGTANPDFRRDGELVAEDRPTIPTGPTPAHHGAPGNWSPEDLLVGAVSQCTMLWFLHLCQRNSIVVSSYIDDATATLTVEGSRGTVSEIALDVSVNIAAGDEELVRSLFEKSNELCYVARSLTIDVVHRLTIERTDVDG
jgi:organic hydroperoxide reductase OsmC/OhrA